MEQSDTRTVNKAKSLLGDLLEHEATSEASWYKLGSNDISVLDVRQGIICGLNEISTPVKSIRSLKMARLYVDAAEVGKATAILEEGGLL